MNHEPKKECFKTSVGGQALMEGIMMRGPKQICCAVRKPDGTIETKIEDTPKHGIWAKIPIVRGAISMIESLITGYRYMMYSAQVSMGDEYDAEEEESAFEKWVGEHLGKKAEDILMAGAALVGGQALMEGIMMRGPEHICCAVRKPDGTIETKIEDTPKHGIWAKIPLVRGALSMIESLITGYRYMMYSAQVSMGDEYDAEEEESAFEKWVGDHLGKKAEDILMAGAALVGGLFAILLFTVLPTVLVGGLGKVVTLTRWPRVILEAVLKVAIFLSYMVAISKMKEIHRVFEYHGAEHKTIACYEAGDELTVENVRKYTRFHPRCGTSFLILVVIVSVFLYSVLPWSSTSLRVLFKLLLLPVVMGISYELLKWCGRSDNIATRIIRQPGLWVQRLTVFEPDDSMIEVAIAAVTPVLPEDPEDGKW